MGLIMLAAVLLTAFTCNAAPATAPATAPAPVRPGTLVVTCLNIPDVQRGAGLLVVMQLPSGKVCLYDTGAAYPDRAAPDGWVGGANSGRDLVAPFLKKAGIKEIDTIFISHAHFDHFGGLLWLVDNIPIRRIVDSGYKFPAASPPAYTSELGQYEKLRETFQKRNAWQEAHTGDKIALDDALTVEVTAPPKEFFTQAYPEVRAKNDPPAHYLVNANSLGIRIKHGDVTFLLPGDIQAEDQVRSLLPSLPADALKCDILIAPGHGLHATKEFAEAARPKVTFCSVFPRYARGLPAWKVYGAVGSQVYATGIHGWLRATSDGKKYEIEVESPQAKR